MKLYIKHTPIKIASFICSLCLVLSGLSGQHNAQFIYGQITTKSDETYEGFMRWGKEELTWHDTFNSTKADDQYKKGRNKGSGLWGDFDWSISSLWKDKYQGSSHTFACQFGDISILHIRSRGKVDVELKNGSIIKVDGGSNDVGATIRMKDYELGLIKFDWDRIERITFMNPPLDRDPRYGTLIYGEVETTRSGNFKGYIKWDDDERMGDDILDGDSRNGDQQVPFENIKSIEKKRNGSLVTFKSGRSLVLDGSNDVDDGNRGIVVFQENVGTVNIPWEEFEQLNMEAPPVGPGYREFDHPFALKGRVRLYDGDILDGQIIFDLDEMWSIEVLHGEDDDIEYQIPFRNIKRVVPKNRSYSMIYLKNGDELLLGETQDVSDSNDGVAVFQNNDDKPIRIKWDDIDEIIFD